MNSLNRAPSPALGAERSGVNTENLQSRIRGTLLMAMADQQRMLLPSTATNQSWRWGTTPSTAT